MGKRGAEMKSGKERWGGGGKPTVSQHRQTPRLTLNHKIFRKKKQDKKKRRKHTERWKVKCRNQNTGRSLKCEGTKTEEAGYGKLRI